MDGRRTGGHGDRARPARGPLRSPLLALVLLGVGGWASAVMAADRVTLQLRWEHQFQFAGYYAALWRGYYADAGIEVDIRPGLQADGSIRKATTEVTEGRAQFGVGAADILVARDKGADLVILAAVLQQSPAALYALPHTKMASPSDLLSLRVLRLPGDLIDVEIQAMLRMEGIDPARLPYQPLPPVGDMSRTLIDGVAQALQAYQISAPWHLREQGAGALKVLKPFDYGVDFYGDTLFAAGALARSNPDLVERFRKASMDGWRYALDHPEEIAQRIAETFRPTVPFRDFVGYNHFQAATIRALTLYPTVDPGHINPRRWARMHETLKNAGLVSGDFDPAKAIFDPDLLARRHVETMRQVLLWGAAVLLVLGVVTWIVAMRRTVARQTREIRERDERLSAALAASHTGTFRWEVRSDHVQWDESLYRVFGRFPTASPLPLATLLEWVVPDDRPAIVDAYAHCRRTLGDFVIEYRILRPDGAVRWVAASGRTLPGPDGKPQTMTGACTDVTDRKEAEERQRLLAHEVDHRAKNLLATVRSMFAQTAGHTGGSVEALMTTFQRRIEAMARAHDLLTRSNWEGIGLRGLIGDELAPYVREAARIEGPSVRLKPKAALALSMVLHELATNAAKYGALSQSGGRLEVRWRMDGADTLALCWKESGGPPVTEPAQRGFGSSLIEKILTYEVKGSTRLHFAADGLRCDIHLPAGQIVGPIGKEEDGGEQDDTSADGKTMPCTPLAASPPASLRGKRILVVEDMMLIAMTVEAALFDIGAEAVGPASDLEEALSLAGREELDGAILDVNLNGVESFAVADRLVERGVTVVFATGYDGATILPPRFVGFPVLRKPFDQGDIQALAARVFGTAGAISEPRGLRETPPSAPFP